jgi:Zn-dependent metalloprotease
MRLEQTGGGTRQDIERVFFRAVSGLLPSRTSFSMTRNAMLQSARDLFGQASAVEAAVLAGWAAAGY